MAFKSWRLGVSILAPPLLLCAVACVQIYLAHTAGLSPWKGGGFGMFSTVDRTEARFLRFYLVTDQGEIPVRPFPHSSFKVMQLQALPTRARLREIAGIVARGVWVRDCQLSDETSAPLRMLEPEEKIPASARRVEFRRVKVELWKYAFDGRESKLRASRLLDVSVDSGRTE